MRDSDTAIVMADTRRPEFYRSTTKQAPYTRYAALTAWLNAHYAQRHGYQFVFFVYTELYCAHQHWGLRHPSYCKLVAIATALQRYSTIAFIDSDSFFSATAPSLSRVLATHQHELFQDDMAAVHFASDRPFTVGPNCGYAFVDL